MRWEYKHEFIYLRTQTAEVKLKTGGDNFYTEESGKEVRSAPNHPYLIEELNKRGEDSWEITNMTPWFSWFVRTYYQGAVMESAFTHPSHLMGYYCTFKRPRAE